MGNPHPTPKEKYATSCREGKVTEVRHEEVKFLFRKGSPNLSIIMPRSKTLRYMKSPDSANLIISIHVMVRFENIVI